MDLFDSNKIAFNLPDAELIYYPKFFDLNRSDTIFEELKTSIPWQHDTITVFGKTHPQPRLTALFASNTKPYSYSNIIMNPHPFNTVLSEIKSKVEQAADHHFTTVLLNLYRNGSDSNGWHADNEKELGKNPVIASVSFGEARVFHFKHRTIKNQKHKLILEHGSLLLMKGSMQHYWLHHIPKTKKQIGARINLTFRTLN